MRKILFIGLFLLTGYVFSQDYKVETKTSEKIDGTSTVTKSIKLVTEGSTFPMTEITVYNSVNGNKAENYFIFSYLGKEWRFYTNVTFNVDGTVFTIPMQNIRETMTGGVMEICLINIAPDFLAAIKRATSIKYQMSANRYVDTIHTLPEGALEALKSIL